jgi:hypothetical protein
MVDHRAPTAIWAGFNVPYRIIIITVYNVQIIHYTLALLNGQVVLCILLVFHVEATGYLLKKQDHLRKQLSFHSSEHIHPLIVLPITSHPASPHHNSTSLKSNHSVQSDSSSLRLLARSPELSPHLHVLIGIYSAPIRV